MPTLSKPKTLERESGLPSRSVAVGIDPGANGAIAIIGSEGDLSTIKLQDSLVELWCILDNISKLNCSCVLEQVGGYAGEGHPGSAMFNFGKGVGRLEAFLYAYEIPFEQVTPQRWQKEFRVPPRSKKEPKSAHKKRLKEIACRLFPQVRITNDTADAILLAEYCRRKINGTLEVSRS